MKLFTTRQTSCGSFDNFIFEYIWLDSDKEFRSKTKIMTNLEVMEIGALDSLFGLNSDNRMTVAKLLPDWNYEGSSTGQATTDNSEIVLRPCCVFVDPFRTNHKNPYPAYLVLCETYHLTGEPTSSNTREKAVKLFETHADAEPWFGLEQEYFIIDKNNLPLGFSLTDNGIIEYPSPQGKYYCGVGSDKLFGREIAEQHMKDCLTAGVKICGINAEVAPSQWEYQIGICNGIESADHLSMSRYIMGRTTELYGMTATIHPKPLGSNNEWNGSGCHTNFSTKAMREENGIVKIQETINKLSEQHSHDILYFGLQNENRLTGNNETSDYYSFSWGVANRKASVRIPHQVMVDKKGYFEDRRPAANCDPYLVTSLIMKASM